jgi:hypothetical protein
LCTSEAHAASISHRTGGSRLHQAGGCVGGGAGLGALGPRVCELVGVVMPHVKRRLDRHRQVLEAGHGQTHVAAVDLQHDPRGRSIGPPEWHAEGPPIRVLDVDVALALTDADQPDQRERPATKRVRGQDDGHAVAG